LIPILSAVENIGRRLRISHQAYGANDLIENAFLKGGFLSFIPQRAILQGMIAVDGKASAN
jgi:hypothetical protein